MGNQSSVQGGTLCSQANNLLVCFDAKYCCEESTTLIVQQGALIGDNYRIRDEYGVKRFKVQGVIMTLSDRKMLLDPQDQVIGSICDKKRFINIGKYYTQVIYHGMGKQDSDRAVVVDKKQFAFGWSMTARVLDKDSIDPEARETLVITRPSWWFYEFSVYRGYPSEGGQLVAKLTRTNVWAPRSLFLGSVTYIVEIAQGVDAALIVALLTTVVEMTSED